MKDKMITITAAVLITGLIIQAASFFFLPGVLPAVLPATACIAALIFSINRSPADYTRAAIAGVLAGIMFAPFTGTPAVAAAGIIACTAGAVAALAVFSEMNRNGEDHFSPVFSIFSGTMISGMFIMMAALVGMPLPGPSLILGEFSTLLMVSLFAGVIGQGILILLKEVD